jgi:hypothetical protein
MLLTSLPGHGDFRPQLGQEEQKDVITVAQKDTMVAWPTWSGNVAGLRMDFESTASGICQWTGCGRRDRSKESLKL